MGIENRRWIFLIGFASLVIIEGCLLGIQDSRWLSIAHAQSDRPGEVDTNGDGNGNAGQNPDSNDGNGDGPGNQGQGPGNDNGGGLGPGDNPGNAPDNPGNDPGGNPGNDTGGDTGDTGGDTGDTGGDTGDTGGDTGDTGGDTGDTGGDTGDTGGDNGSSGPGADHAAGGPNSSGGEGDGHASWRGSDPWATPKPLPEVSASPLETVPPVSQLPLSAAPPVSLPPSTSVNLGGEHEPGELLGVDVDRATMEALRARGYAIVATRLLPELGVILSRIRVPYGQSAEEALADLEQSMPGQSSFGLNHVYRVAAATPCQGPRCTGLALVGWPAPTAGCFTPLRIGMLDTGVLTDHPALRDQSIVTRRFSTDETPSDTVHGTAVASLLVGDVSSEFPGLLEGASLFAGDVFVRDQEGGLRSNALMLAEGVDWLLAQRVSVVNISIAGPADRVLQMAVQRLVDKGVIPVAAAGNNGPDAAPAYPAAYDGVVAVTAVDRRLRPYAQANRGDYLSFAAPGVQVWIPGPSGEGGRYQQGTSFAAPYVSAALATLLRQQSQSISPAQLVGELGRGARDLGAPGHDEIYGWGLIQAVGTVCP